MSLNVLAAIELAGVVAGKQPIAQTLSDASTLYQTFEAMEAKTFDLVGMAEKGTLQPVIASVARSATVLDQLLRDPAQAPRVVALVKSLKG